VILEGNAIHPLRVGLKPELELEMEYNMVAVTRKQHIKLRIYDSSTLIIHQRANCPSAVVTRFF
jgi:hypothetical protein